MRPIWPKRPSTWGTAVVAADVEANMEETRTWPRGRSESDLVTNLPPPPRGLDRRTVLRGLLLAPTAGAVLAACSDDSPKPAATTLEERPTGGASTDQPVAARGDSSALPTPQPAEGIDMATGITVVGTGNAGVTPDRATLTLGVETRGADAASALRANNDAANKLMDLLKAQGVKTEDLQTQGLSIGPQFDSSAQRVVGYVVSNSVTARVRDIATTGPIIDAAASAIGDSIRLEGIQFSVADPTAAHDEARKAATTDARRVAELIATAAGIKLGAIRSIRLLDVGSVALQTNFNVAQGRAASVPVAAGTEQIQASVEVVFDLA